MDETLLDMYAKEEIPARARSIITGRLVLVVLSALMFVMLIVVLILVGIMVGRRDTSVSNAVRHLFVRVDSQRLPVLPSDYPQRDADLLLIVGDGWAGGLGVEDTADNSWWAQMRTLYFPDIAVVRAVNSSARAADVGYLSTRLSLPSTVQGMTVAIVVQCGWNDIVAAQVAGQLDALDLHAMADQIAAAAKALTKQASLSRASRVSVYLVDYADASAGTGFTGMDCEAPLNTIYNHAISVSGHLRALDMFSQALLGAAHNEGFAFVPLRATLAAVGAPESMHATARVDHRPVGVDGKHLPSSPPPAAFTTRCGLMSDSGQHYQADLVAAHILNQPYFIVA